MIGLPYLFILSAFGWIPEGINGRSVNLKNKGKIPHILKGMCYKKECYISLNVERVKNLRS